MKRRFTKLERLAVYLAQDGRSVVSGKPLGADFHADHRTPFSKGGATSIENCDALTPNENLTKGAKINRYVWQDEFLRRYLAHLEKDFFLCALPGAGKTRAAIRVIQAWIEQGGIFIIASPTVVMRRHWRTQLERAGIYGDEKFYGVLREGYKGGLVTYSGLHSLVGALQKLCIDRPVLFVGDEIHHASEHEDSTWGADVRGSFSSARRRLLLSGTPVRSDCETTSFLRIEQVEDDDGAVISQYRMDTCYDWPRALADRVVRTLTFHRMKMDHVTVQFKKRGEQILGTDDDSWLNYALDDKTFVMKVLQRAIDCLNDLRKSDPTAAGLVTCKHIGHANTVFELLQLLGERPVIVTSAEEESSIDVIEAFAIDNQKKWLISVKQVSEGVDIPRLRVLAYLTFYRTDLAFRQLVGRVVRRREHETDALAQAHVFLPEFPPLLKLAEKIEKLQAIAFKKGTGGEGPGERDEGKLVVGSQPEFVGYLIHGRHYTGDRASVIAQLMSAYRVSEESAALMLDDDNFAKGLKVGETPQQMMPEAETPPWIAEELLKSEIKELLKELIQLRKQRQGLGEHYDPVVYRRLVKEIHIETMVNRTSQTRMSVPQLKQKKERLAQLIMRERAI